MTNKRRFIESVNSGDIKPQNKTKLEVTQMLKDKNFAPYPGKAEDADSADYGYLLGMSMWSMTKEKVEEL